MTELRRECALALLFGALLLLGAALPARGQVIEPDVPSSGYSVGPGGAVSSWNAEGGYAIAPGGGYSTWSGPVVVPAPVPVPWAPVWAAPAAVAPAPPSLVPDGWPQ